jgi:hypothetical protein
VNAFCQNQVPVTVTVTHFVAQQDYVHFKANISLAWYFTNHFNCLGRIPHISGFVGKNHKPVDSSDLLAYAVSCLLLIFFFKQKSNAKQVAFGK